MDVVDDKKKIGDDDDNEDDGGDEDDDVENDSDGGDDDDDDDDDGQETKSSITKKATKKTASKSSSSSSSSSSSTYSSLKSSTSFDPITSASWKPGQRVPYSAVVEAMCKLDATTNCLEKTAITRDLFRCIIATTPADLLPVVYLMCNEVAPSYENVEIGIGDATLMKAIARSTGREQSIIMQEFLKGGDLGEVAMKSRAKQRILVSFLMGWWDWIELILTSLSPFL